MFELMFALVRRHSDPVADGDHSVWRRSAHLSLAHRQSRNPRAEHVRSQIEHTVHDPASEKDWCTPLDRLVKPIFRQVQKSDNKQ